MFEGAIVTSPVHVGLCEKKRATNLRLVAQASCMLIGQGPGGQLPAGLLFEPKSNRTFEVRTECRDSRQLGLAQFGTAHFLVDISLFSCANSE